MASIVLSSMLVLTLANGDNIEVLVGLVEGETISNLESSFVGVVPEFEIELLSSVVPKLMLGGFDGVISELSSLA
ncbi:hypothetical protein WICPIJ_009413 [Wickerhamomyces pijperi]|uniref:Secreted protein n=1 Tax=Wickerhamomyces pijperi TaxID=599730 RepID=A0A9P8PMD9_WICPI|nr:hypothetical protein WICPIJ_009413 [Wickerhamomyces pijperi]